MKLLIRVLSVAATIALLISPCGFCAQCRERCQTKTSLSRLRRSIIRLAALHGEERFPEGAQLMLVHEGKAAPLVKGFAASADANVSFDGKSVLFCRQARRRRSMANMGTYDCRWFGAQDYRQRNRCYSPFLSASRAVGLCTANIRRVSTGGCRRRRSIHACAHRRRRGVSVRALSPICRRVRFLRMCCSTGAFCLKPTTRLERDQRRSFTWSTPMALVLSRTGAIMGARGGAVGSCLRAMWSSRTDLRWRASLRPLRMRFRW